MILVAHGYYIHAEYSVITHSLLKALSNLYEYEIPNAAYKGYFDVSPSFSERSQDKKSGLG